MLHCGVFVVFELTCNTKIKPFIKNLYEKIGIEFFNIQTKYEHCTLDSIFFTQINRLVDLTWYTGEGGGGQEHGFLHGLELEPLLVISPSLGQNLSQQL